MAQFPIGFGAITVSYNLSGVKSGIKLDGKTLGDIFLGKVKKWNDPEITALNPGLSLPSTAITVVHRSDSSGTTKAFTTFLSDYSPAWTAAAGKPDKTVKWPTGTGAKGNSGVAAAVKQTSGSIGYVEQAYALQNGFTYASVKNSSGKYIAPTIAAASAAAEGIKVPPDLTISTINSPNAAAYPITSQTFVIVYKDMCKAGHQPERGVRRQEVPDLRSRTGPGGREAAVLRAASGFAAEQGPGPAHDADLQRIAALSRSSVDASVTTVGGGRSVLERSPLHRLPDQVLQWGLSALAAGVLVLIAYFFIRLIGQSSTAFSHIGFLNFFVARQLGRLPAAVGRCVHDRRQRGLHVRRVGADPRDADHVGDRAGDRGPGGDRDRTVRHRALPAAFPGTAGAPRRPACRGALGRVRPVGRIRSDPAPQAVSAISGRQVLVPAVRRRHGGRAPATSSLG